MRWLDPTLCDPIDGSPPGSSVPGILQAKTLEWVAISFSNTQNLLLKLEKAEAAHDVELAVATIEQLRALPGEAVADLDNSLARRLGELNIRRLFVGKNRQWVKEVVVRRGDSATRIASENGSTLASLLKLNELPSADRLRIGQKLDVMDHPRFTIVVHRAAKYADLTFRQYQTCGSCSLLSAHRLGACWHTVGVE